VSGYGFTVPGDAVPKGRPRTARIGGRTITRTPTRTENYEAVIKACAAGQAPPSPLEGPLRVTILEVRRRPQRLNRKRDPDDRMPCDKRPDIDNIAKIVLDALDGWWWHDDGQVCELHATKMYAERGGRPSLVVHVERVDDGG